MAPQSHQPVFHLLGRRIPAAESAEMLGRVVQHFDDPTFDFTPASPAKCLSPERFATFLLGVQYDNTAHFRAKAFRDDRIWTKVKGLLSVSVDSAAGGSTEIVSPRIITRRLKSELGYFSALRTMPEVRHKIIDMCAPGSKAYLIVGTMSAHTACVKQTGSRSHRTEATTTVPVSSVAAAAGVPLSLGTGPDPQIGLQKSDESGWQLAYNATAVGHGGEADEGAEEVFAVSVKEIGRSWAGLGKDVKLRAKQPEYRGGQHFGANHEDESDEESEDGETMEDALKLAVDDLYLVDAAHEALVVDNSVLILE